MDNRFDNSRVHGFLHADGRKTVNAEGKEVLLRGWAAGNWTNPEGFMVGVGTGYMHEGMKPGLHLHQRFTTARSMSSVVRDLCGSAYLNSFWPRWQTAHLSEDDIRAMAEWGYNSIRLPITAWVLMPEEPEITFDERGFAMLDRILDWCEKYRIYAILDMHGAPGGQSGLCCDDGLDNIPHMFIEPESRMRTLKLWEEIARRYADRWIVGGYDLLNEPISVSRWHYLTSELESFYDDAIAAIRKHDKNHIVFLEGVLFSTNMNIFHRAYDCECNNWGISIHLYNVSPEERELYKFIEVSHRLNVPIWIGEGRLKNPGMAVFYEIAAKHNMGYNLWVWKSVRNDEDSGAVTYELPEGFQAVLDFCMTGGPRPSYSESQRLFDEMLENIRYSNCKINRPAHLYCQRRQGITIPGAGYDPDGFKGNWHLGNAMAYRTEDRMHLVMRDGKNVPDAFAMDAPPPVRDPLGTMLLQLDESDCVCYTVRFVTTPCPVVLKARSTEGGCLRIESESKITEMNVPQGAEFAEYAILTLSPADERIVHLKAAKGSVQIESIAFQEALQ